MATTYTEYAKFNYLHGVSGSENKEPRIFASGSSESTPKLYISQSTGIVDLAGGNSLTVAGDSGSGDINLSSDTFTIAGTSNEVDTSFSGTTLTVGLPTNVTVAGNLTLGGNIIGDADENKVIFAATTTATNTITLGGGGQVVAAGDLDVADDVTLSSDSAVLSLGAGADATLTHDGTTGLTIAATPISINSTGNLTLDSSTDIILDAGGADVLFKDDGTQFGAIKQDTSKMVVSASLAADLELIGGDTGDIFLDASDKVILDADGGALLFKDGGTLQMKLNMAHGSGQSFSSSVSGDDILFECSPVGEIARFDASATSLLMASTNKIEFNDATQYINGSSAADLDIAATTDVNIDCTTLDVNAAMDVSGQAVFQTGIVPDANDGAYLGQAGTAFSDLFLAEGGVINWDSGDVTMTQTGNLLSVAGGNLRAIRLEVDSAADYLDVDTDFKMVAAADIVLSAAGGNVVPGSADGAALGSAAAEWSDIFLADSSTIQFGNDQDTTLTHTDGTGLTLNSTNKLCFQDTATFVNSSADGQLDIDADVEVEISTVTLDIDATTAVAITSPSVVIDSGTSDKPVLEIQNTNADANPATLKFNKNSASPADNDEVGEIDFYADDDGGASDLLAKILVTQTDVTATEEDAKIDFKVRVAGSLKTMTWGNAAGLVLPNDSTNGIVTAHSYVTYSDETLKTNINSLDNALDTVKSLRGVSYDWKNDGKSDIGFIAQEVNQVIPEVVRANNGEGDHFGLDYARLTAVLVEAVKELAAKVENNDK